MPSAQSLIIKYLEICEADEGSQNETLQTHFEMILRKECLTSIVLAPNQGRPGGW